MPHAGLPSVMGRLFQTLQKAKDNGTRITRIWLIFTDKSKTGPEWSKMKNKNRVKQYYNQCVMRVIHLFSGSKSALIR